MQEYLNTFKIYYLPKDLEFYNKASYYRRMLRQKGIILRNTIDILIAMTAIYYDFKLLHSDKDFDFFASEVKELKIYN